jgi:hypothetical protein
LVPFDPKIGAALQPEVLEGSDGGEYSLVYRITPDGSDVRTRFLGPSEALSAGFAIVRESDGDQRAMIAVAGLRGGPVHRVALARWRVYTSGRVRDLRVRTEPVLEIRIYRDLEPGELVAPCEWRPWIDGRGVGAWRR